MPEPIRAAVREYGDGIRAYAAADAVTQSSLQVRLDAPTAAQRLSTWLKDLARPPMRRDVPFRTTARDRIVAQVIDDLAPVIRAIDYARQATGRIPLPSVNPEILLRNHASLNDKILSIFDRGMINLDKGGSGFVGPVAQFSMGFCTLWSECPPIATSAGMTVVGCGG